MTPQPIAATRDRLLEAARYLFWEKGYAATGMAEILERAEARSGSFYHFFASKKALLLAVLDAYLEALEPVIVQPAIAQESDAVNRIFAILEGYRQRLRGTDCRYGCPIGRLALEIEPENLPAHARIAANFEAWTSAVRKLLDDARFPTGTDLDALATLVLTVMEGGVMQSRCSRRIGPFDQSVAQLRNYIRLLTKGAIHDKATGKRKGRRARHHGS